MSDEKRPQDHCDEAVRHTEEATELAEHIQERVAWDSLEPQFDALIELIDKGYQSSLKAQVALENEEDSDE
ncbi:hypothetical protein OSG_eHP12_00175 [environmental Halophage eHP-12]|nr:hypothetical protein OSG_eHP12_00175 [environmental Halophage eHP-12]